MPKYKFAYGVTFAVLAVAATGAGLQRALDRYIAKEDERIKNKQINELKF